MRQISEDEMMGNKEVYIELVNSIEREGFDKQRLIEMLNSTDFFYAPASAKYHLACKGGLCQHSLNVYKNLKNLVNNSPLKDTVSEDTIKIISLFHDFAKINCYTTTVQNKKVYCESGSKHDQMGRFDWVSVPGYARLEDSERFIYGNHEETSEYIVRCYVPLTVEESCCILYHHGGMSYDSVKADVSPIYCRYPIACLLHLADMMATYINENE